MIKDTTFEKALVISLTIHLLILLPWPGFQFLKYKFYNQQKISPEIVVYKLGKKNEVKIEKVSGKEIENKQKLSSGPKFPKQTSIHEVKKIKRQEDKNPRNEIKKLKVHSGPQLPKVENREIKKSQVVTLSGKLESKTLSPSVLNYYRAIREEIKKRAYYYKPQVRGNGAVTVLFTLSRDGVLRELVVDNSTSTNQEIFRQAALKSVKYASPFPPFPPELKEDYITFSITIEFNLTER